MPRARPRRGLASLVLLALPCLGSPPARRPAGRPVPRPPDTARRVPIYVVSNGWHTEIVVREATLPDGRWPARALPGASVPRGRVGGPGRLSGRPSHPAARAPGGLRVAGQRAPGHRLRRADLGAVPRARRRRASAVGRRPSGALARFIEASLAGDGEGRLVRLEPGWTASSAFYPARGRFHLLNTCNAWTARALRAAGLPLCARADVHGLSLMQQVVPLGRRVVRPRRRIVATGARP